MCSPRLKVSLAHRGASGFAPEETVPAYEIARRLGVTLKHIISVNGLRASSIIHPGQRLHAYRPPRR